MTEPFIPHAVDESNPAHVVGELLLLINLDSGVRKWRQNEYSALREVKFRYSIPSRIITPGTEITVLGKTMIVGVEWDLLEAYQLNRIRKYKRTYRR